MKTFDKNAISKWVTNHRQAILIALGCLMGIILYAVMRNSSPYPPERMAAWEKITPRLQAAHQAGERTAQQHSDLVHQFFAERSKRATAFAEEVLSLGGKWEYVKSAVGISDADAHRRYLHERFEEMVISASELEDLLHSVVTGCVQDLQGIENDLLVQIRADLGNSDLAQTPGGTMLQTEEAFRQQYGRSLEQVAVLVGQDVTVQVAREAASMVAGDIATTLAVSLMTACAERLGISAGVLGTGMASGAATLGLGIAASFLVDALLDQMLAWAGYDPTGNIAQKVCETLKRCEDLLLEGDPNGAAGNVGLRRELQRLHESRYQLREKALKALILEGMPS
jgi:hypothetical protein